MIIFSNLSLKRGQTELLENASATINPKQKSVWWGKWLWKIFAFALLKRINARGRRGKLSVKLAGVLGESRNACIGYFCD